MMENIYSPKTNLLSNYTYIKNMKEEFATYLLTNTTSDTNHVTSRWSLRWGNPQTGAEDASPVGQPWSVPQQHSISNVMEALVLALLVAAKDL